MECFRCKGANPDGQSFCGACGAPLDLALGPFREILESRVGEQVHAALADEFKAQRDKAEALVEQVEQMGRQARRGSLWVAVPLVALILILFLLELRTYYDFAGRLEIARHDLDQKLQQSREQAQAIQKERDALQEEYTRLRRLNPAATKESLAPVLHEEVRAALNEKLKDAKVVEMEAAQAAVLRVSEWGKLLGFVVGIPVAILAAVLGVLGVKTAGDLRDLVDTVQKRAQQGLQKSRERAEAKMIRQTNDAHQEVVRITQSATQNIEKLTQDFMAKYQELSERLSGLTKLEEQFKSLNSKVEGIEKIVVKSSVPLPEGTVKELEESLAKFQQYIRNVGFESGAEKAEIRVIPGYHKGKPADYDRVDKCMYVRRDSIGNKDALYFAYARYALAKSSRGAPRRYGGVKGGLARYFVCSYKNEPKYYQEVGGGSIPASLLPE